jgi:subtilase family serine protease
MLAACSGGGGSVAPQRTEQHTATSASRVTAPFNYSVHPKLRRLGDLLLHNCAGTGSGDCLSPTTVRSGYNFTYTAGVDDGTGQTIVIVDAYGSPTIKNDLKQFDKLVGLPDGPALQVVFPGGNVSANLNNATQLGWAEETTLDVEWAHAAAPGAQIVLVLANNDQGSTVQATQLFAAQNYPSSAMSLSFGTQELSINGGANNTQLTQAQTIFTTAANNHITVIASAGDSGANGGLSSANPQYPASDPHVLSVGGTNLTLFHNGNYRNESVWNDADNCLSPCLLGADGATGGAPSLYFTNALLPHQALLTGSNARGVADVAYNASPNTGVEIYIGFTAKGITPGTYAVGGTSQGPPQYAGIVAVANQLRAHLTPAKGALGFMTDYLYQYYTQDQALGTKGAPFHDVTNGDNKFPSGATGFTATGGYDYPTGLGSPNINNLLNLLVNQVP